MKKSNITLEFLIKLIVAAVLIFVVATVGFMIVKSILGDSSKNSKASFEALASLIESKSRVAKEYDSSTLQVYLDNTYIMVFFDKDISNPCGTIRYRPTWCKDNKRCACLYKGTPGTNVETADNNIVTCKTFTKDFTFDLDPELMCKRDGKFFAVIVEKEGNSSIIMHLWKNNEDNRKKDQELFSKYNPTPTINTTTNSTNNSNNSNKP